MSKFSERLGSATNEDKQVNPIYVQAIAKELPKVGCIDNNVVNGIDTDTIIYPEIKTDGVYKCYYIDDSVGTKHNYLLQLECKLDIDFTDRDARANVILQVICYLKQIHDNVLGYNTLWDDSGIPKVVVIGSKINCFALPTKFLTPYAMERIAGFKSASTAYTNTDNAYLLQRIKDDAQIEAYSIIFNTVENDCIKSLCNEIVKLAKNLKIADDLNEHTVSLAFDFFDMYVLDTKSASKLSSREKVDLFIGTFFNEEFEETKTNRFASNPDKLRIHGVEVKVNPDKYNQFKIMYNMREYSRLEQKQITAITDRLLEDTDRRRKGDFYTPSIWVDEAHKLLDRNLGENWRDEYMVWDCAWGTGNLTRDYQFADLYCSTLQQEDLNIATRYNRNATKFQYDFLNDDVEDFERIKAVLRKPLLYKQGVNLDVVENWLSFDKVIELYQFMVEKNVVTMDECREAYQTAINILHGTKLYKNAPSLIDGMLGDENGEHRKKLVFLINPPYGTSGEMKNVHSEIEHKIGIADTCINELMTDEKIGTCSRQLIAQFMYRINKIQRLFGADISLSMFSPTSVLTSNDYEGLLNRIDYHMGYTDGIMFCASEFADVQPTWGIMFALYNTNNSNHNRLCNIDVMCIGNELKAEVMFNKTLYMIDKSRKASWWTKEPIESIPKTKDVCYLKSALNVNSGKPHNMCINTSIGGFISSANNVNENTQFVALLSGMSGAAKGLNLGRENYDRVISLFAARKLISGTYANWINSKDEYMVPNTEHPLYEQWQSDCIVYSLFNTASNQSSLRNIEYNGKTWNIQNEFFWMSVKDIEKLAGGEFSTDDINTAIEDDIEVFGKERFVYKKLQTVTLSPDAQAVLDKATELVKSSFKYRKQFNQEHPEYHINTWDAGWYQIKGMLKQYDPEGLKQFNELYKQLEDRMRPLVYELGFLYK